MPELTPGESAYIAETIRNLETWERSRYVTGAPENPRLGGNTDSTPPGEQVQEPRYRLMRLCECQTCNGSGKNYSAIDPSHPRGGVERCPDCRGEGRTLEEVARCDTPADLGVALVTLARENEFDGCPIGIIDDQGETGHKWLVRPWLASPRNVSDAARTLAKSKGEK